MPYSRQPYTFDRVVRLIISALIIAGLIWLINRLSGVLLPFLVACLIAYLLEPFVKYNMRLLHLRGRASATFVTLFEVLFIILIGSYFCIPLLIEEIVNMGSVLKQYASASHTTVPYLPEGIHEFIRRNIDFNAISEYLSTDQMASIVENALSTSWSIITGSISMIITIVGWMIVFLYVVFIMIDYDRMSRGVRWLVPPRWRRTVFSLAREVETSMNLYFRGQALVAAIVGVLFAIGFVIIGLPMAVVLGLFIGVLNLVPYLQLISIVPTTLLCLIYAAGGNGSFWTIFAECMAVYAIVQLIQDMFLVPKIMGKQMGLNPTIILLSLSIWGSLLGFIGLIIALPLTTLLLTYYDRYVIRHEKDRKIMSE